jgi:glycosyltransferase involved in cell wall biosynthesis
MIVTIVTPSLNGVEYLAECIASVQAQASSRVDVEHVFVDGGSTDGTPEMAAAAGCTVLTREENSLTYGLNKGARHARGTLIGILGCDDILLPGALEEVVRHYRQDGRRWLVGGCRWIDAAGGPLGEHKAPPSWLTAPMLASMDWGGVPALSTFLHRDFLRELGYFDTDFSYAADHELYAKALAREEFSRIPRALAAQRRHGSNLSMERTARHRAEMAAITLRYAPDEAWKRAAYRVLLKAWMNGMSPTWFVHKRIDKLRDRRHASPPTR